VYYTGTQKEQMKFRLTRFLGLVLLLTLTSCAGLGTSPTTPEAISAPTSTPSAPSHVSPAALPPLCDCILRFDRISIEQGLSQSSARVVFQDSRGFIWIGTEDGLNRYDGYTFKTFKPDPDVSSSLSDRWITSIVEDKDGYLWIGTRLGGLNRYDPQSEQFAQYLHDETNPFTISDSQVNVLYIDKQDNLWVGTTSGLDRFDPSSNRFEHQRFSPLQTEKTFNRNITAILEDNEGRLWVGSVDGGLTRIDPKGNSFFFSYQHDDKNDNTISYSNVTAIIEGQDNSLWVGTRNGLNRFEPKTGHFERFMHADDQDQSISNNAINSLLLDSTGNLWIATARGLDRLNAEDKTFSHYRHDPTFLKSLSEDFVLSIFEDRGGVLWFGTYGGGVNKYDRQRDNFEYYRNDPNDSATLSSNFVFPIYPDAEGNVWIGTSTEGLNRFDTATKKVTVFRNNPQNSNTIRSDSVTSITQTRDGLLWIGTSNGLERYDQRARAFKHYVYEDTDPESLGSNRIYKVYVDSKNNIWVGTSVGLDRLNPKTGKFVHYVPQADNPNSLSGGYVDAILEDKDGNLWLGTFDDGLNKFDPVTQTFTAYRYSSKDKTSISNDAIFSIHQDARGRIWIGTGGGGLNLYHPETDSFTYYLEKDGLPNGVVYGILEDPEGNLWMSTNFGISRFNPETEVFRNFDEGDGLQSNEFNGGAYAMGPDGKFYFGGINGLTVFDPLRITDNPFVPQITLTSLTQDDQPIAVASSVETIQNVTLTWPQNSLEFEFAALSYNQPSKNHYAYMLQGFDTNWHFIDTKRNGRYTNLPGGEYTLLLKGTNSDGVWTEYAVPIHVQVIPPFWQTLWFQILLGVTAVAMVFTGVRLRTHAIQDRNRELERLVRERTSALEKRNQEIQALYEADERILRNVSLNQVFQTLVDVAVDVLDADRSVVFAWDEQQTKVIPRVSHGFSTETLKVMEFSKGEGVVGEVLATGKPVIVRQLELNNFRPDVREALIAEGIRSFVHLPIVVDHKVVGVFNVGFTRPNLIGDDTTRLFSALAHRASISIANMELFEQTKDLAVMEERNRLARDLHDSAKQKAFAALAQLGTARGILNGHENSAGIHLTEAENLVSDVIQELTFLVQEIYPLALQEKGLITTLREHIFEWENRNDVTVQFTIQNERRLPLEVEQALYRVAQETLANIARHSHATRVDVSLVYNGESVQLSVADNGYGFDTNKNSHGMGLRSIRERVSSIRGTVQIQSAPGHGTRLLLQVPIKG
jgi:ligand-binding sensor domain-containing protein/signal transduction histidine kinase